MSDKDLSTKQKIKLAAIDLIGRDGIQSLTIRRIAKEAGVNNAAINYYFGSKEKLVAEAMKQTLDEMSGLPAEILDLENLLPRDRIEAFLEAIIMGIVNYPGITKSHLYNPMIKNEYNTYFVRRFNAFLGDVLSRIKSMEKKDKNIDLKLALVQIMSAVVFPSLISRIFDPFIRMNFKDTKERRRYVKSLVSLYFK